MTQVAEAVAGVRFTKLRAGDWMVPVRIEPEDNRLALHFGYCPDLIAEVKVMQGAIWHGRDDENPRKCWTISDSPRNRFQLAYLEGKNPYARYDQPLVPYSPTRPLYEHQVEMVRHGLTVHYGIWGAEPGTGKTLAAISLMEASGLGYWIWVGPRSALEAVQLEMDKWKCTVRPTFLTYDGLRGHFEHGRNFENLPVPQGVIFDEASKLKTPTAARSKAGQALADRIREEHGEHGYVILMTGTPAPKSPVDWWKLCEIACPGYLREGRPDKFRDRLAMVVKEEGFDGGGSFPKIITWWDDERKCKKCGKFKEDSIHSMERALTNSGHLFESSVNEVAALGRRLTGLVRVYRKSECLDLPEKQYRVIRVQPKPETLRAAKMIVSGAAHGASALILLRELSDGFQYQEKEVGQEICKACKGTKVRLEMVPTLDMIGKSEVEEGTFAEQEVPCSVCKGKGTVKTYQRTAHQLPTPKQQVLENLLEEHEEVGRLVVYAGFTGSVDRCVEICRRLGWKTIRVDGRGWESDLGTDDAKEMLRRFQGKEDKRIVFIGQPGAAGMGLTLTASPTIFFWSNDFNGESRPQAEDRIHRPGLDENRGATIVDVFHLPTDELVLNNLQKKKDLQTLSMSEIRNSLEVV